MSTNDHLALNSTTDLIDRTSYAKADEESKTNPFNVNMLTDLVKRLSFNAQNNKVENIDQSCKSDSCIALTTNGFEKIDSTNANVASDRDLLHLVKKIIKTKPTNIVDNFIEIYIQILSELHLNTIVSFECKNLYTFDLAEIKDSHSDICTANNEAFISTDFDKMNHLDTFISNRFKSLINISGKNMYEMYKNFCHIYYPEFKPPSNRMFLKAMKIYTGESKQKWLKKSSPEEKN